MRRKDNSMVDIVERLHYAGYNDARLLEAANEIERLREGLKIASAAVASNDALIAEQNTLAAERQEWALKLQSCVNEHRNAAMEADLRTQAAVRGEKQALAEVERLCDVLRRKGFVPCDIAECNCGSWHARYGLPERWNEVKAALAEAGHPLCNKNGNLVHEALKELIAERDILRDGRTTLCWNCNTVYPIVDMQCQSCGATNANRDPETAAIEVRAKTKTPNVKCGT